ncbi:MAG: signal peptidase II [Nevskia sp.]|jgi:signal peptidase II|uniref:signal peptidase II n=1 Tax=Nevskia sp. TaxID=1929292 RepID=UPI0040354E98
MSEARAAKKPFDNLRLLWIAAFVIAVDQLTKHFVDRALVLYDSIAVLPHFNLVRLHNTGAAFSMLNTAPAAMFIVLSSAVSIGILWWLRSNRHGQLLNALAFVFVLGGALGNAIDRAMRGYVLDFIQFFVGDWHFAAFNVADMAITFGAGLMILDLILQSVRRPVPPA